MINAVTHNPDQQLVQKANEFVNMVFWGTMLREFRQAQRPTILDGGPGSSTFIRQLDLELLKRIGQKGQTPLADALLKQLSSQRMQRMQKELNKGRVDQAYQHERGLNING